MTEEEEYMTQFFFLQRKQTKQRREKNKVRAEEEEHEISAWRDQKIMRANFNLWLYIFRPVCNNRQPSLVKLKYWGNLSELLVHRAPNMCCIYQADAPGFVCHVQECLQGAPLSTLHMYEHRTVTVWCVFHQIYWGRTTVRLLRGGVDGFYERQWRTEKETSIEFRPVFT